MAEFRVKGEQDVSARDRVLAVAVRLFSGQGYFNTSIPDIVRESGVSTGSIYHHFRDKEGIAKALFDTLTERLETEFSAIEARLPATGDRCRAIIEFLFRLTEREPEVMEFMLYAKHKEFLPGEAPICSSKPFRRMREIVAEGIVKGEVREMDANIAAAAVYGPAIRLIQLRLDGIFERPLTGALDEVWDCAWRAVEM